MKIKTFTAAMTVLAIVGITLGVWFSPSHGQPHQDMAQQVSVDVVDDEGDPVIGASVTVQRFDGTRWVNGGSGGSADTSGNTTVEMATTAGSYRVVLTVPQGYTEDYDDADGMSPGPNNECSGMERRCVAYVVDANRVARLQNPQPGADGLSFTFYVRDDTPEPRAHLTQYDVTTSTRTPLYGGTINVTPTRIVVVNGQNVVQRGTTTSQTVSTAGWTLFVDAGSYEIEWVPPTGYVKVSPTWKHSVTVPVRGSVSLTFTARTGAIDSDESYGQTDGQPDRQTGQQTDAGQAYSAGAWGPAPAAEAQSPTSTVPEPDDDQQRDSPGDVTSPGGTSSAGSTGTTAGASDGSPSTTTTTTTTVPPEETYGEEPYGEQPTEEDPYVEEGLAGEEGPAGELTDGEMTGVETTVDPAIGEPVDGEAITYEYDELCSGATPPPACFVTGATSTRIDAG